MAELCTVVSCILDARWGCLFAAKICDIVRMLTPPLVHVKKSISMGFSYTFECKPIIWPDTWLTLARGVSYDAEHAKYAWLHLFQSIKTVIVVHLFMLVHFQ